MKYIKKSLISEDASLVEAFKFTGGIEQAEDPIWIIEALRSGKAYFKNDGTPQVQIYIKTSSGPMEANINDYIMKWSNGEIYPCGHNIFESTYKSI